MKIGALDQVLTGQGGARDWARHYALAAELGFDGMEPGVGADYAETQLWSAAGRREMLLAAQLHGVATSSICLHSFWRYSFASPDEAVQAQAAQIAREGALACAELGAANILVPLTCPDDVPDEAARQRWVAGMRACASAAEDSGVCLCLENVGKPFANRPDDIARIVDAIDSPAVQVYYDPGNAVRFGTDPLGDIAVLGGRIRQAHVKEYGAPLLGDGRVPWPPILAALRAAGFDGWLVLETEPTAHPLAAAGYNLTALRKMLRAR
jgi:sugar phosphate isomerase/epimerase